ncbi:glucosamine-6-phosphate deaminase [Garciella nitratireducens]|uniref:Glucosamine-6-phosphate deaminase n=1 Tax=Garciella nitratireducens DSM 15102 TaxID=1121911 RepID=A0A1T4M5E6_9FIRM|nr:glucosamine-6-phosphate deaminase [Garciella nitratireducens]RBP44029.1 glucosamine-6-phosphate deaminase [Garciella nitratireducens]SJZ62008.1 glucosamine-6-phosphate deaminase [Garciella nitratireducens DSM 15102]
MRILEVKDYQEMSKKAANIVASQIILKPNSVLGLATGSTPIGMYQDLIKIYQKGYIDFSDIKTFNLDEYYKLPKDHPQSYYYFMQQYLFNHININPDHTHIPNGMAKNIEKECEEYEQKIKDAGGIDLQVLGIGKNGHIGFNEPDNVFERKTHLVNLKEQTIQSNARFFDSIEQVPTQAITMGIQTIIDSKKILLLASGKNKADAIYQCIYGKISPQVPASILQLHPDVTFIIDEEAALKL